MEPIDDNFRELFKQQRAQDQRHVPPFDVLAQSVSQRPSTRAMFPKVRLSAGFAIGFALILLTGLVVSHLQQHLFEKEMRQWASLSEWAAATDSFLSQPHLALNENVTDSFMKLQTQTPESSSSLNP